jgi:integrase
MAYARQRGKTFSARWTTRDGRPAEKGGFLTKKLALNFAQEQEALERREKNTRPSDLNMNMSEYVQDHWGPSLDVTKQTKEDYQRQYNCHIAPYFGQRPMSSIRPEDILKWRVQLKDKPATTGYQLSANTVEKLTNLLGAILKDALANDRIHNNPMQKIKRKKPKQEKRIVPLSFETVQALAVGFAPRWQILVWIGYYTGLRPSEMLGLTWDRLDYEKSTITVDRQLSRFSDQIFEKHLKTAKTYRTIPFPVVLQVLITDHVNRFGLGPHGLLLQNRSGKVWRYKDASAMFREVARPLGLEKGEGLHQLRHTFVSLLIQLNLNVKQIQEWLGHESILETMDRYGHLFPNSLNEASQKLDSHAATELQSRTSTRMLA